MLPRGIRRQPPGKQYAPRHYLWKINYLRQTPK